jgi:hypothetical protein
MAIDISQAMLDRARSRALAYWIESTFADRSIVQSAGLNQLFVCGKATRASTSE